MSIPHTMMMVFMHFVHRTMRFRFPSLTTFSQDPATGEPMDHFRNTPVEKKQAVRTYERFSQVVSHLLQPNGRVLVVSEWGGRSVKVRT